MVEIYWMKGKQQPDDYPVHVRRGQRYLALRRYVEEELARLWRSMCTSDR